MQHFISFSTLTNGSGGTGISSLLTAESITQTCSIDDDAFLLSSSIFSRTQDSSYPGGITTLCHLLLNAGDSTQRVCSENKIKSSKLNTIILTSMAPHHIAGLPGMILNLSSLVKSIILVSDTMVSYYYY